MTTNQPSEAGKISPRKVCRHCGTVWETPNQIHQCVGSLIGELMESERVSSLNLAAAERCAGERDRLRAQLAEAEAVIATMKALQSDKVQLARDYDASQAALKVYADGYVKMEKERDALRGQLAEVEAQNKTLRAAFATADDQMEHSNAMVVKVEAERDAAQARAKDLRDLLKLAMFFGEHSRECCFVRVNAPCDCGLHDAKHRIDAALAGGT